MSRSRINPRERPRYRRGAAVESEAKKSWAGDRLEGKLKAVIINFHTGDKPSVDLDNMSKPILDAMQQIVYDDDRQIRQAEFARRGSTPRSSSWAPPR